MHDSGAHVAGFAPSTSHIYNTGWKVSADSSLRRGRCFHASRQNRAASRDRRNVRLRNRRYSESSAGSEDFDDEADDLSQDVDEKSTPNDDERGARRYVGRQTSGRLRDRCESSTGRTAGLGERRRSHSSSPMRCEVAKRRRASASRPSSDCDRTKRMHWGERGGGLSQESEDSRNETGRDDRHKKERRRRERANTSSSRYPTCIFVGYQYCGEVT